MNKNSFRSSSERTRSCIFFLALSAILSISCTEKRKSSEEPSISVGVVSAPHITFSLSGPFRITGEKQAVLDKGTYTATDEWEGRILEPLDMDSCLFTLEEVQIGIGFHWQRNERQTFEGALKFIRNEDGLLTAVNIIPLERYLFSVISSEMKATASLEFLKAHAIISRSWLLAGHASLLPPSFAPSVPCVKTNGYDNDTLHLKWYDQENHRLFDVCADDHCQRYQGIHRAVTPQVKEAIESTRGMVLCDREGKVCDARFYKCCGGHTEQFSSAWGDIDYDYLQSVEDPFCNTTDREILSQVLNDYDLETNDFYRWKVEYSNRELSSLLYEKSGIDFGRISALEPLKRGASGRIVLLRIVGEKKTLTIGKELEIRKFLSHSHLYSSAFTVETLPQNEVETVPGQSQDNYPDTFILHGSGWGHGVGLCQIGAAVMANRGYPFEEILNHYYPTSTLTRLY